MPLSKLSSEFIISFGYADSILLQLRLPDTSDMALVYSVVTASVLAITTSLSSGTSQILPPPATQTPEASGIVNIHLNTTGAYTSRPIISTSISTSETTVEIGVATSITSGDQGE